MMMHKNVVVRGEESGLLMVDGRQVGEDREDGRDGSWIELEAQDDAGSGMLLPCIREEDFRGKRAAVAGAVAGDPLIPRVR